MLRSEKIRLGEVLVKQGLLTEEQLEHALLEQELSGRKLGRIIIESKLATELQISEALAKQLQIPFVELKNFNFKLEVVRKLPEVLARRFRAVVLEDRGDNYLVGMADPTDLFAYDEILHALKKQIQITVVLESRLLEIIDQAYRRTEEISTLVQELDEDLGDNAIDFFRLEADADVDEAPVVRLLQTIFEDAVQIKASDIHIEPQEHKLFIRFRIDGVMHMQAEADLKIAPALALRLKLMSNLDIAEKRLPQDGRFAVKVRKLAVDVRISTMPTQYGESVVMRLLIQNAASFTLEKLGMPPQMLERFRKLIRHPNGLVLVTGPTGSGKTTTLYAALSELNTVDNKIITVEDPVEYRLPGINQVQVNEKIELGFSRVLRSTLRQDPDIILIGEMRDHETAQIGLRAAMTGHMVLSTLHTNDAISTPARLYDMEIPRYMVSMSLLAVIAQRLVRVVCDRCAQPYTPLPFERDWLEYELGETLDRHEYVQGTGCVGCNGSGYQGRVGVYELLVMSKELVEAANKEDQGDFNRLAREQLVGNTMRKYAVDLILSKRTTISEAMRISYDLEDL